MQRGEAAQEWRTYWPLILSGIIGTTVIGAQVHPVGTMMKPLQEAYGWDRTIISASASISSTSTLLFSTVVGLALDRWGPRRVAMVGAPLMAAVMACIGFTPPNPVAWLIAWTLYAFCAVMLLPITFGAAITSAFKASRGLALGIGLCGTGVSPIFYPFYTLWLLDNFGVRGVYLGLSLFILVSMALVLAFAFYPPKTHAGALAKLDPVDLPPGEQAWGVPLLRALRTSMLWRIVLVLGVSAICASFINPHLQALLNDGGLSRTKAAVIRAVTGPCVMVGRWAGGWLLDRVHARWILLTFYLLPALGCLLLMNVDGSYWRGFAAAVLIGFSLGVEGDLLPFLLSRYFGVRWFGSMYGFGMAIFGLGYAIGPLTAGRVFDLTRSYDMFLIPLSVGLVVAGLVGLTYPAYPKGVEDAPGTKA